ncbi:universal stress protein, partial [Mycolicibacterium palauense]|uniref:universal stress protein n=1 Tax=Mycolicibacterium palauense TaxID=2034511 RepID=UPI0011458AF9
MAEDTHHTGVVVGVDGSPAASLAVRWAADEAALRGVPLTVVHVLPPTASPWLDSSLAPEWMRCRRQIGSDLIDAARALALTAG